MKTSFIVNYKLASKAGLDYGEVGGFSGSQVFASASQCLEFLNKYGTANSYRGLNYYQQRALPNNTMFFYGVPEIFRRELLFDKIDIRPRMRCPQPPKETPAKYELEGQNNKFQPHPLLGK